MLGGYLAQFMWKRNCTIMGVDPFDQILADIATYYNPDDWRSCAEANIFQSCTTERKQRVAQRRGVNLVSWWMMVMHGIRFSLH